MNRREALGAMGAIGAGGVVHGALSGDFKGVLRDDEIKVGDIVECTVSWPKYYDAYQKKHIDIADAKRFMGEIFKNGDTKRFKLLDEYGHGLPFFDVVSSSNHAYPIFNDNVVNMVHYGSAYSGPCHWEAPEELTLHVMLDGNTFGSFTTKTSETVKWSKVYGPCDDYHAEKFVKIGHLTWS